MTDRLRKISLIKKIVAMILVLAFINLNSVFASASASAAKNDKPKASSTCSSDDAPAFSEFERASVRTNYRPKKRSALPYVLIAVGAAAAATVLILLLVKKNDSNGNTGNGNSTSVTFHNPVFTDINVTVNGVTKTATVGSSVTFNSISGNTVTYYAETFGKTTSGTQVGLKMIWDNTLSLSNGSNSIYLDVDSDYFFLYIKNNGNHNLSPIYVNYGLQGQSQDNVVVQTGGQQFRLGYYKAFSNGNVRAYYQDNPSTYVYWNHGQHYNLPFTDNQSVILTNSQTSSVRVDEKLERNFTMDASGAQGLIVENNIRGRVEHGKDAIVHYGRAEK